MAYGFSCWDNNFFLLLLRITHLFFSSAGKFWGTEEEGETRKICSSFYSTYHWILSHIVLQLRINPRWDAQLTQDEISTLVCKVFRRQMYREVGGGGCSAIIIINYYFSHRFAVHFYFIIMFRLDSRAALRFANRYIDMLISADRQPDIFVLLIWSRSVYNFQRIFLLVDEQKRWEILTIFIL